MTESTPAILAYTHPPPPRQNRLAGADPQWLRTLSRGCLLLTFASVAAGAIHAYRPVVYFANALLPLIPTSAYTASNVLFSIGAMMAVFPRPPSNDPSDDAVATSRTLVWMGQGIVLGNDLLQILADNPGVAHPSATLLTVANRVSVIAGLVAVLALSRYLRHRAHEMADDRTAAHLKVVFILYLICRGFSVVTIFVGTANRNQVVLRQMITRLNVGAHVGTTIALAFLAVACWSLSAAFRQTADAPAPADHP